MLFIGEKVGAAVRDKTRKYPEVDIAVDPLEGTNLSATGESNAIVVLAPSDRGGRFHAPDLYMVRIIVGPSYKGAVELDTPVKDNLRVIAKRLDRNVEDLVVIVLDRPRHERLIQDVRAVGARFRLISDGDSPLGRNQRGCPRHRRARSDGHWPCSGRRLYGCGAALPEWADSGRLVVPNAEHKERLAQMGIRDPRRICDTEDLAPGKKIIFACAGVTGGGPQRGVRFFSDGTRTQSLILTLEERKVRFVDSVHLEKRPDVRVRFCQNSAARILFRRLVRF